MKVAIIGTGYVGLVSGACFSELGWEVVCFDKDTGKIDALNAGRIPIFEPGLEDLVGKNKEKGRLRFTHERAVAIKGADVIFIAVGTPTRPGAQNADLSFVFEAAREMAPDIKEGVVIVTKSTVPVGTTRQVYETICSLTETSFHTASNPEFLREGGAIADFMHPDRIVVGTASPYAQSVMEALYAPLVKQGASLFLTQVETAELIKYASNTFLAMKISFINQVADLAEACGADVQLIAEAMGLDRRIGPSFLHPGPGFGGSCFPKDTRALAAFAHEQGVPAPLIDAVDTFNEARKRAMVTKIVKACGGTVRGKKLAILGITFKANTDDIRESASLVILPALREAGASLAVFDPEAKASSLPELSGIRDASDVVTACHQADAIVILTEWDLFKTLPFREIVRVVAHPLLIDLRNLYTPDVVEKAGFSYVSLGRPARSLPEKG
jgi:UDPglucose 6-dehydrogenase